MLILLYFILIFNLICFLFIRIIMLLRTLVCFNLKGLKIIASIITLRNLFFAGLKIKLFLCNNLYVVSKCLFYNLSGKSQSIIIIDINTSILNKIIGFIHIIRSIKKRSEPYRKSVPFTKI